MELKQQSALEFIVTYSWALIIISLFIVSILVISDTKAPITYLQSSCSIQPLFPCTESLLTYNAVNSVVPFKYYLIFTNQLGSVIYFPQNSINLTTSNLGKNGVQHNIGNCTPAFASQGATVLCRANIPSTLKPNIGTQVIANFVLNYSICTSNTIKSCAPGYYKSSGYSVQNIAPTGISLNNISFVTNPGGTIVINGAIYFSGTSAFFTTGNYIIYAQPPAGKKFTSWSIASPSSTVLSTSSQNTIMTVSSNAVLTATFG